jgi:hypothetical protein
MEDREKLVKEKISEEDQIEFTKLKGVQQFVWEVLINDKKYEPGDIAVEPQFTLQLSNCQAIVSMDLFITLSGVNFLAIKCSSSDIESWERYVTAFARVANDYQIPFAMVTDGINAKIVDVLKGNRIGESIHDLFTRQQALEIMKGFKKIPCPESRAEKEKRIVYAFEGIKCPTVK